MMQPQLCQDTMAENNFQTQTPQTSLDAVIAKMLLPGMHATSGGHTCQQGGCGHPMQQKQPAISQQVETN
jgi:hypothetical protein